MKLALGTAQFGLNYGVANESGRITFEDASEILKFASESGINTLDTAIAYGDSESVLGSIGVQSWNVVTKLPPVPDGCQDIGRWVRQSVKDSINRLNANRLYAVMLHRPMQLFENIGAQLYAALTSLKEDGLTEKIGISVYAPTEIESLIRHFTFEIVQAPLNIVDRRLIETGLARKLKQAGIEIHTRSAYLQGLLLMPAQKRPPKFNAWAKIWSTWDSWLQSNDTTALQACTRFALMHEDVDRIVVGIDSLQQIKQIVHTTDKSGISFPTFHALQDDRLINPASWATL